jgi:Zn-finger nucleic acid-binding protein
MRLLVEAGKEALRSCPIDGATMNKEIAHMLVIDRCPACSGVWLDGGELDHMRNGAESEALMLMAASMAHPM